jgi:hypothetical protein
MRLLFIIFVILTINSQAQKANPKDILGEWFTSNKDSCFFKSDTLTFIKRTNREKRDDMKKKQRNFLEPETELTKSTEYVNFEFKRSKKIKFWECSNGGAYGIVWGCPIKWSLKADTLQLSSDSFTWTFKLISTGTLSFEHLINNKPKEEYETLTTETIKFIRIK